MVKKDLTVSDVHVPATMNSKKGVLKSGCGYLATKIQKLRLSDNNTNQ